MTRAVEDQLTRLVVLETSGGGSIADNAVTNAKLADMATATLKGRATIGTGDPEDLTAAQVLTLLGLGSPYVHPNHSGDVTSVSDGAQTIAANAVTNAKLADVATATFKGRTTAGTGDPEDLTVAQAKTLLDLTGTNSGDQTSIVGITGTISQFNTACSDADFATGGGTATGSNTGDQNLFSTIAVSGQSNVVADAASDTLTLVAGSNVTITTDAATGSASNSTTVLLTADVTNNNATANTLADVTGLSFTGAINTSYQIYACIMYTAAATTTGSRWVMAGPAGASANLNSTYTLTATTQTVNSGVGLTTPAAANATSVVASNIAIIEGVVRIGGTSGTVKVQFASEVSSSAIVAKANLSFLEYRAL